MSFLPTGYEVPTSDSNYMKLEKGMNRIRILTSPILGNEYWVSEGDKRKPVRKHMGVNIPVSDLSVDSRTGELDMPKHFWAMTVYNIKSKRVQILEITQKRIQKAIEAMSKSEDWGDPKEYDIEIEREGEKFETVYTVRPCPKKKLDEGVAQMAKDMHINLKALFDGGDPFKSEKITPEDLDEIAGKVK